MIVVPGPYSRGMADPYEIAYREGVRTVDDQARNLEALRGRAGLLVSAAGVTAGLLAIVAKDRSGGLSTIGPVVGIAAFGVGQRGRRRSAGGRSRLAKRTSRQALTLLEPCSRTRTPDPEEVVGFNSDSALIAGRIQAGQYADASELHQELAIWYGNRSRSNARMMRRRFRWQHAGLIAFTVIVASLFGTLVTGEENTMADEKPAESRPRRPAGREAAPKLPDPVLHEERSDRGETKEQGR